MNKTIRIILVSLFLIIFTCCICGTRFKHDDVTYLEQSTATTLTKEETTGVVTTTSTTTEAVTTTMEDIAITTLPVNTNTSTTVAPQKHWVQFKLTAYCGGSCCCGKWAGSPTASGTWPKQGRTIAVYPSQIPYGTEVTIEGLGTYIAEDCGGAIGYNCIDIYMDSHSAAQEFGVKYAMVSW